MFMFPENEPDDNFLRFNGGKQKESFDKDVDEVREFELFLLIYPLSKIETSELSSVMSITLSSYQKKKKNQNQTQKNIF